MDVEGAAIEGESEPEVARKGRGKARLLTLEDLDARTRARKRAEETRQSLIEDLGADTLSKADLIRINQCVLMDALIEDLQVKALQGGQIDRTALATLVNTFSRHLEALTARSAQRKPRPVKMDEPSSRDLARAILDVLRMAELEDAPAPELGYVTLKHSKADSGAKAIGGAATEPVSPPEPPESEIFPNNASVVREEIVPERGQGDSWAPAVCKWAIFDGAGQKIGMRSDRTQAVEAAKALPGSWSPPPAEQVEQVDIIDETPREARIIPINSHTPRVIHTRRSRNHHG